MKYGYRAQVKDGDDVEGAVEAETMVEAYRAARTQAEVVLSSSFTISLWPIQDFIHGHLHEFPKIGGPQAEA